MRPNLCRRFVKNDKGTDGFCNCTKERREIRICGNYRLSDGKKQWIYTAFFMGRIIVYQYWHGGVREYIKAKLLIF